MLSKASDDLRHFGLSSSLFLFSTLYVSDQISELLSCLPVDRKETRNEVKFYKCGSKAFLSLTGCSLPEPLILATIKVRIFCGLLRIYEL